MAYPTSISLPSRQGALAYKGEWLELPWIISCVQTLFFYPGGSAGARTFFTRTTFYLVGLGISLREHYRC